MVSAAVPGRFVVVAEPDLGRGFALVGATVISVASADAAQAAVERLLADGERGVIAVHEPFFAEFTDEMHRRLASLAAPVVVELPSGAETTTASRRAKLTAMLQRAIGYSISFGETEP